jgi:hypothetical protein
MLVRELGHKRARELGHKRARGLADQRSAHTFHWY